MSDTGSSGGGIGSVKVRSDAGLYMPANASSLPELTLRGIILGALITVVFTASNVYLGLKVGLTFSSSIPAAVISMAVLSFFARSNILENNMVQTQASAAGTLSAVIFVLPAMLMSGYWVGFHFWQSMAICATGGALGVLFSIPLRRTMVVHSDLPYPEGVAAAEILNAGHKEDSANNSGAKHILSGAIIASIVAFCSSGLGLLSDKIGIWFSAGKSVFQIPLGFSLALVSAGYLMGIAGGLSMLIGTIIGWGVIVPYLTSQASIDMSTMSSMIDGASTVWKEQVRFIGAGTIAIAAVWTLITLLKPMAVGIKLSFKAFSGAGKAAIDRTDEDMSIRSQLIILALVFVALVLLFHGFVADSPLPDAWGWALVALAVVSVLVIGFFIASACGYMAGLIGSSASPISGISIIAIIIVSSVLSLIGSPAGLFETPEARTFGMGLAIFVTSAIACVGAISNDNLQDLKTGLIVGATPKNQQIALLIGCVVGAMIIAPTLGLLYQAYGFSGAVMPREGMDPNAVLSAPQATLMKEIARGIFFKDGDNTTFLIGIALGAGVIIVNIILGVLKSPLRIAALAVGLGLYLPPTIVTAIIVGSLISVGVNRKLKSKDNSGPSENKTGVLIASGFIVGESLMGVAIAIAVLISISMGFSDAPFSIAGFLGATMGDSAATLKDVLGTLVFIFVCVFFYRKSIKS